MADTRADRSTYASGRERLILENVVNMYAVEGPMLTVHYISGSVHFSDALVIVFSQGIHTTLHVLRCAKLMNFLLLH